MIKLQTVRAEDRDLLWNMLTAPFEPEVHLLNEEETVLSIETGKNNAIDEVSPSVHTETGV